MQTKSAFCRAPWFIFVDRNGNGMYFDSLILAILKEAHRENRATDASIYMRIIEGGSLI